MATGIPYDTARQRYRVGATPALRSDASSVDELLKGFHPDHGPNARVALAVGVNRGDACQPGLAQLLQANAQIDDVDIAGAQLVSTDVLVVGGGGGGCAAALSAARARRSGHPGHQASPWRQQHRDGRGRHPGRGGRRRQPAAALRGHPARRPFLGEHELVAQMAMDGPDVIRWLIHLGMQFDLEDGHASFGGKLLRKKPGGATAARILSYRDYTGLEMMRVLREAVDLEPNVSVWNRCAVVELLTDDQGRCAGAVVYNLEWRCFMLVRARAVVLATGGTGRLHFNSFPTSNHFGATGDGLVVAYRPARACASSIPSSTTRPASPTRPTWRAA